MSRITVSKGEVLQRKGVLNSKVYVVETGLLRSYAMDEKGKEHIFMFAPEGWSMADSQGPEEPADLYIDALEDSVVTVKEKEPELQQPNGPALIRRIGVLQKRVLMRIEAAAKRLSQET